MIATVVAICQALAAVPKIADFLQQLTIGLWSWYIQTTSAETRKEIVDAASFAARAQTHEDRQKALDLWRTALSRPRVS